MTEIQKERLFEHKCSANIGVGELLTKHRPDEAIVLEALEVESAIDDELTKFDLWNEYDEWLYAKYGLSRF